jgi:hypothetical protein
MRQVLIGIGHDLIARQIYLKESAPFYGASTPTSRW